MTLKLITFDLDNTLWHTDPVIIKADQVQWQSIITRCPKAESLFTPNTLKQLSLKVAHEQPKLKHKLSLLRQEVLYHFFIQCGFSSSQASRSSQEVFADFLQARNQVELFPGALELLQQLQSQYQVIALSNGNADLTTIGLDHLFNAHYHAENVARPKPSKDMFLAALEYAGVKASESCHIGDHPEQDVQAAKALGFKTVWANILQQKWPSAMNKADHDLTQLNQLPSLITSITHC